MGREGRNARWRPARCAAALAKAQLELTNPEKSLVATIQSDRRGEAGRSFRYAPLEWT